MSRVIAIDGPAASGKGTLARRIAQHLNYAFLDTGALYRAVGLEVLEAGGAPENETDALAGAQTLQNKLNAASSPDLILHNAKLREEATGEAASKVAAIPTIRAALVALQRDFAQNPGNAYEGAVLDGRDIGTVICPDANVKLYITARDEIRAERRTKELQSRGIDATYEPVLRDMRERDERDMNRQDAPLARAQDAIVLDTSDLDPDEVFEKALKIIEERLSS